MIQKAVRGGAAGVKCVTPRSRTQTHVPRSWEGKPLPNLRKSNRSSRRGSVEMNLTRNPKDAGSILGLAQ